MTMSKKETFVRTDRNIEQILKRDNYTCKMCNKNTKDDIDDYQINTTRSTSILINLVTLCKSCYVLIKEAKQYALDHDTNVTSLIIDALTDFLSQKNKK